MSRSPFLEGVRKGLAGTLMSAETLFLQSQKNDIVLIGNLVL